MEKEFYYSVFLMLCLFPETIGFSLQTTQTCGVIGKEFILVGNFTGDPWNPASTREWRGPPSLTLLLSRGAIQTGISGYTESIDSAATDSTFKLHIQSLAWSEVDVPYQCQYRLRTDTFTINSNIVEDYSTTNDDKTDKTNGKNILATITLNAIRPVPTVTALSGGSDITTQAITITSTPDTSNAKLNVVNINVNYTLSGNGGNVTVNLATPCGYAKSYTFKEDVETTTAATTNGSGNGDGLSEGAIAGIVIAVVVVCGVVVCVIVIVIFKKKKNKAQKEQLEKKDSRRTEAQNGEESHNLRNSQQPT